MQRVVSFWKNESKNGNTYYSGKLGELNLVGFKNTKKKNEKEPDLIFYVKEETKKTNKITKDDLKQDDPFQEFSEQIEIDDQFLE